MSENSHSARAVPIDEYRVLWTAQKKQKLKKWHDGFLRFHKFNKRLLVYDDARHLVADMYLRGRDTIEEGDDLEFENHLVTVEDFKGTVVQDLTPLFTSAVKRKQQIQAVNTLISLETPNQANRHGPWGDSSRNATPTLHQHPMDAAGRFPPQTPIQQRPTNMSISLQQSIRANNNIQHPHPYHGRSLGQSPPTRIEPAQRPNRISNPNPTIQQQLRQSGPQTSDAATSSTSYRPPLNYLGGPPSPNRRLSKSPKQQAPLEPPQNHWYSIGRKNAPSYLAPPYVNRGPLSLNRFSEAVRPLKHPPQHSRPGNIFSNPAPVNKSTPDLFVETDSDDELFGSLPDFNTSAPLPPAQGTDLGPPHASKRPSKRTTMPSPEKNPRRVAVSGTDTGESSNSRITQPLPSYRSTTPPRNPQVAVVDSSPIISSGDESAKKKDSFEPLVTAGKILLGNTAKRKRTKLLCQRPPVYTKEPSTATKERENVAKKPRKGPASKESSQPMVVGKIPDEDEAMVDFSDDTPIPPPPVVKKGLSAFKLQSPARVYQNKSGDKSKSIVKDAQYRIEEKEDTAEYQKEHDIGPWSSEALFLFDWGPPGTREEGK